MSSIPAHAELIAVRHGESANNATGRFTGWRDVELTELGREQACAAGRLLRARGATFTTAYTSRLKRAIETADLLLREHGQVTLPRLQHWRLNERHCGAMQGMTKDETYAAFGLDAGRRFRRSWDEAPPAAAAGSPDDPRSDPLYREVVEELPRSESMGDLWARVDLLWRTELRPRLLQGERLLVVGHGMALRALGRSIEGLVEPALPPWKLASAAPRWYGLDAQLRVVAIIDLGGSAPVPGE